MEKEELPGVQFTGSMLNQNFENPVKPSINRLPLPRLLLCLGLLAWVSAASAEAVRTSGILSPDTEWETAYHVIDSQIPGPTVFLTGGMHGNEPAGYRAAEQIRHWPIVKGRLIVVPRVNRLGLAANLRWLPSFRNDRKLRDPNRNFPKKKDQLTAMTPPCQAIWELVQNQEPDWLIDLHEGFDFHVTNSKSVGSTIIYLKAPAINPVAEKMIQRVNDGISNPDRKFDMLRRSGPVKGSLARSALDVLGIKSMILETTFKQQPLSTRTRQQRTMVSVLFQNLGLIDRDCVNVLILEGQSRERLHVGLFDGTGTGEDGVKVLTRIIDKASDMDVCHIGPDDALTDSIAAFDVLIFPGGSGSKQANAMQITGCENVTRYVRDGGGFLGICAGAYLCSSHYSWSLHLVNTAIFTGTRDIPGKGKKSMWYRGKSEQVSMALTEQGKAIFKSAADEVLVRFHNGPIVSPGTDSELPDYETLAYFRSEVVRYEPQKGTMINTPAIVAGEHHAGKVIAISPHPETSPELESIILDSIHWLRRR